MSGVFSGFATITFVIAVGVLLGHLRIVDLDGQRVLADVAFHVGSPALMLTVLATADVRVIMSRNLIATVVGVLVPVTLYLLIARWRWQRTTSQLVIGAFSSVYVNAGNLGIPIAAYVLGDAALVAPTLLLQMVIMQPIGLLVLDHARTGGRFRWRNALTRPLTNPMTVGALIGVALSLSGITLPPVLHDPLALIGGIAVPAMLLGYGIALRLGPRFGGGAPDEVVLTSVLKSLIQPLVAYLFARYALGMSGAPLLAVAVTSALPTAQNIFTHATRYRTSEALARDTILVTTIAAVPVILGVAALLG